MKIIFSNFNYLNHRPNEMGAAGSTMNEQSEITDPWWQSTQVEEQDNTQVRILFYQINSFPNVYYLHKWLNKYCDRLQNKIIYLRKTSNNNII